VRRGRHEVTRGSSAWAITTKHRLGKLPEAGDLPDRLTHHLTEHRFIPFPITVAHAAEPGPLRAPYKDPFDRLLMAQAPWKGCPW
jgi:PIN domain nuclease of toxin-antitoxin system